jgi:hypothetical protein
VTLPDTVIAEVPDSIPVYPVQVIDFAPVFPAEITQLVALVKKTSSAAVGTDAPPPPPKVEAHLEPAVPSQFPPTLRQYLLAI